MSEVKMSVREVAERMDASQQFIRIGLQQGKFPWGYAVRMSKNRFTYYINKEKFMSHEIAEDTCANW